MGRSRMFGGDHPNPSPRTTIVGGRPPEGHGDPHPVPTGIEQLLRLASVDDELKAKLLVDRVAVAEAAGIALTRSEAAIISSIGAEQLTQMIDSLPPPPPQRREFLRAAASSAVVLLGGASLLGGCSMCTAGGAAPDVPPERPQEPRVTAGVPPDVPPPRPEDDPPKPPVGPESSLPPRPHHPASQAGGGAAPDMPENRPDHPRFHGSGGAAPDVPQRPDHSLMPIDGGASPHLRKK